MTAFERYVASGGRRTGFWRVLLGIALIGAFWVAGTMAVIFVWGALNVARYGPDEARDRVGEIAAGGDPETVAVMLLTFLGMWLGVFLAVRLLHAQPFSTLFAPDGGVRGSDLLKGLLVSAVFVGATVPVGMAIADPTATTLPAGQWLAFAAALLALVFVQATAEELVFRGYLLQQLALRSRNPLVWAVIPSALFGALHWANAPTGEVAAYYVAATFLIGLALAALVRRTGNLWAAIGVHVGFNVFGLTIVGSEGVLSGAQLFLFPEEEMLALMRVDVVATALLLAFVLTPWAPFGGRSGPARA